MKRNLKLLPLLLTFVMIFNLGIGVELPVFADETKVYNYEHFSIDYTVKTEWENSQEIGITIRNTSEEALRGWAFEFDAGGEIKDISGAEIYDNDGTVYIVKSTTDNNTIDPGESASFSYTVFGNNLNGLENAPLSFRLVSKRVVLTDGYSVNIKSNANKKTDFEASITIKNTEKNPSGNNGKNNTGKNVIDAWTVSFDANFKLETVERGTFTVDENGRYTITGTGVVSIIRPNVSVQLDISGTKTPNVKPAISNIVITSVKIDNTITPPENEDDENPNTTEITLEAWAEYYENTLTLLWASSLQEGNFIIYTSDNGTDFEKLTTLENTTSYVYTELFTKKYFKIVQKYDSITVESPIITAEKTSDGYVDLSYYDTDGDGLSDYEESILLTDKTKTDTDEDGLTDYEEVYFTGTDPLVYDSAKAGTSDSQADIDSDGLANRDEIDRGTNPVSSDSDYDTLKDGDEVNTYNTDPLKFDTDGDSVSDSDELQLGLNPLSTSTDGTPDNERTFEQTLSADSEPMAYINGESDLKFSVSIAAAGVAENNITASESGYSAAMQNPAIVGVIPEFNYTENLTVSEFTLGVKIPESLVQNQVGTYAADNDEFAGIKRLNFFRFFEEINTLLPVETTFDISTNMMYTKTNDLGTYCVMDMEIWLESLTATETPHENTNEPDSVVETVSMNKSVIRTASLGSPSVFGGNKAGVTMAETSINKDEEYNVIFCVDTRDAELVETYESYIKTIIYSLRNSTRPKANIYWCDKFGNNRSNLWNSDENKDSRLYYKDSAEKYDPASGVTTALRHCDYNPALETYVFIIFSATEVESSSIIANDLLAKLDEINKEETKLHISVISDSSTYVDTAFLPKLIDSTQGTKIAPKSADEVSADVLEYLGAEEVVKIISSTGLQVVSPKFDSEYIKGLTNPKNHLEDTDLDGLPDYKEIAIDSELIDFTQPDDFLPTIQECIDNFTKTGEYTYILGGYSKIWINPDGTEEGKDNERLPAKVTMKTRILPLNSDPTSEDGDEDGILDIDEFEWNEIDELYKDVSPLKADTVESIYSKISRPGGINSIYNPIYLEIRGNHIKINIRYNFKNYSNTNKENLLNGVAEIWSHSYGKPVNESAPKAMLSYFKGKLYDFYPGMKITVELNFIEAEKNCIEITLKNEMESNISKLAYDPEAVWLNHRNSKITLYHRQAVTSDDYTPEQLSYILSHEIGHAMGLADAYAKANNGYEIFTDYSDPNLEIPFGYGYYAYNAGEIMINDGQPCSNDIEMILQAFLEGEQQWFYVTGERIAKGLSISKAIKNPIIVYTNTNSKPHTYFIWDRNSNVWKNSYSKKAMLQYISDNINP